MAKGKGQSYGASKGLKRRPNNIPRERDQVTDHSIKERTLITRKG